MSVHDSIPPRQAHRHSPTEQACCFFEKGFGPAPLPHWDNCNGFGMAAVLAPQAATPGVNYGQGRAGRRHWR